MVTRADRKAVADLNRAAVFSQDWTRWQQYPVSTRYRFHCPPQRKSLVKIDTDAAGEFRNRARLLRNHRAVAIVVMRETMVARVFMTSAVSELLVAVIKLAALQVRFGLLAVEVAASSVGQMLEPSHAENSEPVHRSFDAEVDAAARAIKAKVLGGRDAGFRNMLQINFPDDEIHAMAEAVLTAARGAAKSAPEYRRH